MAYTEVGYVRKANEYIAGVLSGAIPACEYVKQACQRQVDDLAREDFAYRFDVKKAEDKCFLIELLPHIEGPKAGQLLKLEPWQCFILTTVFGWVHKETGLRRFRRVYIEVPKGNGKSALSSGVMAGMLLADGEGGAQVYSAAPTRDQAKIVFGIAQKMLRRVPKLLAKFGAKINAHDITVESTASVARTFSSDADSVEGCNPHFVVIDELHAHPTRMLWDNLETAMGKRDQDMLWAISTAGNDRSGICYEVRAYVLDILAGKKQDDVYFGIVYTIDRKDDPFTEAALIKANPNWGVSFTAADRLQKLTKAMQLASAQPAFKTKHLNVWVNTAHIWMDMRKWDACANPTLDIEQFAGQPGIIGMDLASRIDLAAIVKLFWKTHDDGLRHYYVFGKYWLPEATVEKSENSQYEGWATDKKILTCPGEVNDFRLFKQELIEATKHFQILEIAHDPYLADQIVGELVNEGMPTLVAVAQNVENFSPALKELEAMTLAGRLHHDGDPVLAWAVSNVAVKPDRNDNIYPRKANDQNKNKIDPVVAVLMALNRAMSQSSEDFVWLG
jgi:phage terminase large subunit-like protein